MSTYYKFQPWAFLCGPNSNFPQAVTLECGSTFWGIWCHLLIVIQYHLYRTLSEEVDLAKQPRKRRSYDRLAYAKGLPPPEDISNPDDVMEWLDRRGTISAEWQKLRELWERASKLDASVGKREEDVDLDI